MDLPVLIGSAVGVAVLAAAVVWRQPVLAFAQRTLLFTEHVRFEVRKVTWPSWEQLRQSTVVITIIVILLGVLIGLMDVLFSRLLIDFLGRAFG